VEKENIPSIASRRIFEGVLRHAGGALGALKFHRGLTEAAPRPQAAQVAIALGQRVHHGHDFFVEQAEIAGVARHRQRRHFCSSR
jgi:hypothetical protein